MHRLFKIIPKNFQATVFLRYFGLRKIPLLFFVRPSVIELTNSRVVVNVPLRRRTKNHLGSMYFGALAIGADCAAGLIAMKLIRNSTENISLVFKRMEAEFLKRAESDVHFVCDQGHEISALVAASIATTERVELPVNVIAKVPDKFGDEPVAEFTLILSLKKRV
jgi:acyl-coenzyme A thioesterase PaaI-like protein